MGICENQYTFQGQLHMAKKIISNKLIIFCLSRQFFAYVVLCIHASLPCWATPSVLGDGEPTPDKPLKVYDKVHLKSILDLINCPCGADYVVGGRGQVVLGEVVMGRPQIVGTPYYGGGVGPLGTPGVFIFLITLPFKVINIMEGFWLRTMQRRPWIWTIWWPRCSLISWSSRWLSTIWIRQCEWNVNNQAKGRWACSWCTLGAHRSPCSWA